MQNDQHSETLKVQLELLRIAGRVLNTGDRIARLAAQLNRPSRKPMTPAPGPAAKSSPAPYLVEKAG